MYNILSTRSTEFYVFVCIFMILIYIYEENHHMLHANVRSGLTRGVVTGYVLGGTEGIFPAATILTFLNVASFYFDKFVSNVIGSNAISSR